MPGPIPLPFSRIEVGTAVSADDGWATITFTQAFSRVPVVVVTEEETNGSAMAKPYLTSVTKTGFDVASSNHQVDRVLNWQAIG